jgi:hypothetical protein
MRRPALSLVALSIPVFAACGGNNMGESQPDAAGGGTPDATPFQAAPHEAAPQLVEGAGGVLTAPRVVPIFFGSDTLQGDTETFIHDLVGSDFWTQTTQEYGVGPLVALPSIATTDAAPTSDQGIGTYLATMADGTHAGWPANDQTTIYTVFLPDGDTLSDFPGECTSWLGYHSAAQDAAGNALVYAVIPHCAYPGTGDFLYFRTTALGHEYDEAVTDPIPNTGFGTMDPDHRVWGATPGAEDGDLCEYVGNAHQRLLGGGAYAVQRAWSNASASAGHDPCVPVLKDPYKAATPVLGDSITINTRNGAVTTKGVSIPVGSSKTIEVDLWSDGPTGDFTVNAYDVGAEFRGTTPQLTFTWDKQMGKNGDKLMLTIKHVVAGSTRTGGSEFVITVGTITNNSEMWWGLVGN